MTTEAHTAFGEWAAGTGDRPVGDILDEVAEWQTMRETLSEMEEHGDPVRPDDWEASDDHAVTLLQELADAVTVDLATATPDPAATAGPQPVHAAADGDEASKIARLHDQLQQAQADLAVVADCVNWLENGLNRYGTLDDEMAPDQQPDGPSDGEDR